MKRFVFILALLSSLYAVKSQSFTQVNYQGSDENFANPERGFYHYVSSVDYDQLVSFREEEAITLIYKNYRLDDYTETEIPLWFLQNMEKEFATMRKAGIKCVLRYNYTFDSSPPYGDARPEIVLQHVAQLKPYLQANSDVIYVLQAGFIGAWGEWYYTDYYQDWDDRRELMDALLDAMPPDRQVQLRTPNYKQEIMSADDYVPVSEEEAFTNTPIARIGHHNDCFVASSSDYGTYQDSAVEKPYLADDTKYTLMGGETCAVCECASCENSLRELKRFHWSYINIDYHTAVLQGWKDEGCYPTVERKLGFRYRMVSASVQNEAKPGGKFNLNVKILNEGWANPGNPRNVELILRNNENNETYYLPLTDNPRYWSLDDTIVISVEAGLPGEIALANYSTYLNLPDPSPSIADNPAFSIRTANTDTWESSTGYNSLQAVVEINDNNELPDYTGGNLFKSKNTVLPDDINIKIDGKTDDWNHMSPTYTNQSQTAKTFKNFNTNDSMYFAITGNGLQAATQLFIDADKDTETGYVAWQWSANGADYLIENNFLYQYTGTDHAWGWAQIGTVSNVSNDTVIEMGFSLHELNGIPLSLSFSIGFVNDPEGTVESAYIPSQNELFLILNQVAVFGSPRALGATTYSNNNIVFWTNENASPAAYNVLERSEDGTNYEQILVGANKIVSYVDKNLEENKTYNYRVNFRSGNINSNSRGPLEKMTSSLEKVFVNIELDGNVEDWNMVAPAATGFNEEMVTIRLTNLGEQLFYSISGELVLDYQIYFGTQTGDNYKYKICNDSVFFKEDDSWVFEKTIYGVGSESFLEAGLNLSDTSFINADYFFITATVNGAKIPVNYDSFTYSKPPIIPEPQYFRAEPSVNDYYTKSVVKWQKSENSGGYIIERSVGDSLNFELIAELSSSASYHVDSDLDSSMRYYYRMFAFNDIYRSVYTPISSMKPGTGMGIDDLNDLSNATLVVSPNPFHQYARIDITVKQPEYLKIDIYDNMYRYIHTVFEGRVVSKKVIDYKSDYLNSGFHFIKVVGPKTHITHKIIVN